MINLISDEKVLSEMIEDFKSQGFDQIRISGGTSKDGSFFAGVLPVKYENIRKEVFFIVVPYNSKYYKEGEANNNKRSDEIPEQTALRELFEETGLIIPKEQLILAWEKYVKDTRPWSPPDTYHRKQIFVADGFDESHYFTFKGPNKISAETMAPVCISVNLLVDVLYEGHLNALKGAISKLIGKDINYYYSLQGVIDKINKKQFDYYQSTKASLE